MKGAGRLPAFRVIGISRVSVWNPNTQKIIAPENCPALGVTLAIGAPAAIDWPPTSEARRAAASLLSQTVPAAMGSVGLAP